MSSLVKSTRLRYGLFSGQNPEKLSLASLYVAVLQAQCTDDPSCLIFITAL